MNVNALLDFQNELLKPFAPSQEFALITLIVPHTDEETVVDYCTEIQYRFPHVASLYDAYAIKRPENAIPLIVPVADKTNVREELFELKAGSVGLSEDFYLLLSTYVSRVPEHVSSPDELHLGASDRIARLTLDDLSAAIMHGFYSGVPPIVGETKRKSAGFWRTLFPSAA
ncbi:hypothetical protein JA33_286 [Dickeya phage vB_DsoM_JA33]|uniref:Uncharacterized protein n=3 Tax=Salmondvirus JA11 TaxID=2734141 RepID=A0A384ZWS8_9CAUD|nr:hypothetical protein HOU32_gp285 [Dickeya phage vB_DsoM_JA11]AXG66691.1 hypothetical protein JA13_288 [Dickeya phage vB_DsoM_JA13]AXG67660.1 hypothetical protein JA33_286 [Dickeya phage vB_DsoM_JA33]AYD80090.1 hypothetical protein JA11_285 [Dickeya phage vB_DsoM_JA11]